MLLFMSVTRRIGLGMAAALAMLGCASQQASERAATPAARAMDRSGGGHGVREATLQESPDPDRMNVRLSQGYIAQADAEDAIARRFRDLTGCYQQAGPAQDFAGGGVTLRFLLSERGTADDVQVIDSRLGSYPVERCLVRVGREVVFPRPQGGATTFEYTLEFRAAGGTSVIELSAGALEPHLGAQLPRIVQGCGGLGADAVTATLYVAPSGTVRSVGLAATGLLDDATARCVWDTVSAFHLPLAELSGAVVARVSLPLSATEVLAAAEHAARPRVSPVRRKRGRAAR